MKELRSNPKEDRQLWRVVVQTVRPFPLTSTAAQKLLVAVSGGADSMALQHLLWQQLGGERLVVAHLNHQLRPEADEEAAFVAQTAASWGIPCEMATVPVADLARKTGLSLEAAGRLARYRFLAEKAETLAADAVVVAHHGDDQAETVLLHLLRGSGSSGLRGMQAVSVVPESDGMILLRPFLNISRAEIEAYCTRHGLEYREDASNEDIKFTRNRIRHELLPLLQTYNPQISVSLQRLATITADDYAALQRQFDQIWPDLLRGQGEDWLVLDRRQFAEQAAAWQRMALRRAVKQLRPHIIEVGFQTIELARSLILENKSGTEAVLPGGLSMELSADEILLGTAQAGQLGTLPQMVTAQALPLPLPGMVELANGWVIRADWAADSAFSQISQNDDPWRAFGVLDEGEALWVRPFHPGERFHPLGMGGRSQRVADLLSERKVARDLRPLWPIVATANHPVWIVGCHLDNRARVQAKSFRIVQLTCFRI